MGQAWDLLRRIIGIGCIVLGVVKVIGVSVAGALVGPFVGWWLFGVVVGLVVLGVLLVRVGASMLDRDTAARGDDVTKLQMLLLCFSAAPRVGG
jgi:hypothetical protein